MPSILLTAPALEPVSLAEAKAFLRVETSDDDAVFDYGVNSGIGRAGKVLRRCLKLSDATAAIADEVVAAAKAAGAEFLIGAICDERLHFLKALPTWRVFGPGWERRVAEVRQTALVMAAQSTQA